MKIIKLKYPDVIENTKLSAAIGYFDGVHLAHRKLIENAVYKAKKHNFTSAIITFEPDPTSVLHPDVDYHYLSSFKDKCDIFQELGIELVIALHFDKDFSCLSCDNFMNYLVKLNVKHLTCGFNFHFSEKGCGSAVDLQNFTGFKVTVIPEITDISSTNIIKLLNQGEIERCNDFLGRLHFIYGKVVKGLGNGHKMGFPTANIDMDFPYVLPKQGVYLGKAEVFDKEYYAMINIGKNLTYFAEKATLEVHIANFSKKITGKTIKVSFSKYLRPVKKFSSIEKLIEQLNKDRKQLAEFAKKNLK